MVPPQPTAKIGPGGWVRSSGVGRPWMSVSGTVEVLASWVQPKPSQRMIVPFQPTAHTSLMLRPKTAKRSSRVGTVRSSYQTGATAASGGPLPASAESSLLHAKCAEQASPRINEERHLDT